MSNQYPYGNDGYDDQTRQYRRADYQQSPFQQNNPQNNPQSVPQNYPQNYPQQPYANTYDSYDNRDSGDNRESSGPSLIAGKFEAAKVTVNLVLLGVLSAVVTFAVILVVDQIIAAITDTVAQGPGAAVVNGVVAGVVGVLAGLLYIPVSGTGNEGLFNAAIVALTVAAAVFYVIFGGLLDKDWSTLLSLAAILCAGITAYAAPTRIETARVR